MSSSAQSRPTRCHDHRQWNRCVRWRQAGFFRVRVPARCQGFRCGRGRRSLRPQASSHYHRIQTWTSRAFQSEHRNVRLRTGQSRRWDQVWSSIGGPTSWNKRRRCCRPHIRLQAGRIRRYGHHSNSHSHRRSRVYLDTSRHRARNPWHLCLQRGFRSRRRSTFRHAAHNWSSRESMRHCRL